MKIFVALSGGVDSAVAAHILQTEGHDVTGVFIRVWQPDFLPCSQDEEERAALRVAAQLGIPFQRLDLSEEYKRDVVDEMIAEYRQGRTPNPDVLCNSSVKFGAFLKHAQKEGAEKIATGHHAQVQENCGTFQLVRGADSAKDQAYFLWKLTQEQLKHTLMPIGGMSKAGVRLYAEEHNIPSATKPDSQGLCFIGHVDMKTFLKNFIQTSPGNVLDETGTIIGEHEGAELITLGQRGGFTITKQDAYKPVYYVTQRDIENNTITVSASPNVAAQTQKSIKLVDTSWSIEPTDEKPYTCEIRYHGEPLACRIEHTEKNASVHLKEPILVAAGQSLVLYENDVCLGGGIVA